MKTIVCLIIFFVAGAYSYASCEGFVKGDPVFTGFEGQKFIFKGAPFRNYSIFNDKWTNLNAQFDYANPSTKKGTVMKQIGLLIGSVSFIVHADAVNHKNESITLTINAKERSLGHDEHYSSDCIDLYFEKGHKFDYLTISTPLHTFGVHLWHNENRKHMNTTFIALEIAYPPELPSGIGGVLGQTASKHHASVDEKLFKVSGLLIGDSASGHFDMNHKYDSCTMKEIVVSKGRREAHNKRSGCELPDVVNAHDWALVPLGTTVYINPGTNAIANLAVIAPSVDPDTVSVSVSVKSNKRGQYMGVFETQPFYDLYKNMLYFESNTKVSEIITLKLQWSYLGLKETVEVYLQFCALGDPKCIPIPSPGTQRKLFVGEVCDPTKIDDGDDNGGEEAATPVKEKRCVLQGDCKDICSRSSTDPNDIQVFCAKDGICKYKK